MWGRRLFDVHSTKTLSSGLDFSVAKEQVEDHEYLKTFNLIP